MLLPKRILECTTSSVLILGSFNRALGSVRGELMPYTTHSHPTPLHSILGTHSCSSGSLNLQTNSDSCVFKMLPDKTPRPFTLDSTKFAFKILLKNDLLSFLVFLSAILAPHLWTWLPTPGSWISLRTLE